jgi:N-acylglucosamine 2-epimerase
MVECSSLMPAPPAGWSELSATVQPAVCTALEDSILPFWWRTIDRERGGILNCWNNAGTERVRRDKFTWSQGRFAWLWSRLAEVSARGLLPEGDAAAFTAQAEKTIAFLEAHAFLPDGRCAFLLTEDGRVQEAVPGAGPAPSIYADCFVTMGLAEFARVTKDPTRLDAAWRLLESIETRIAAGGFPTHPDPIPEGYHSHAITMIHLNVTLVLHAACVDLADTRADLARTRSTAAAARIFEVFMRPGGRLVELWPKSEADHDTVLARHINPGHALEGLWMLMGVAVREGRADWLARAAEAAEFAFVRGWDEEFGGLLHYVDHAGGPPQGRPGESRYEHSVNSSWSTKLWWVHSEAIYTALLWFRLTGNPAARRWFERVFEYAFRVFPQPDPAIGEWIQIRDRAGQPLERVVALPVKDPYHIARNLIQVLELFSPCQPTQP